MYDGVAVGSDGTVLAEVPLDLAQVSNFPGEEKRKGEPVRIGSYFEGQGCMVCHTANMDSFPQSTTPFPWTPWFDSSLVGTWECTSFSQTERSALPEGGTGFRVTFRCDGTEEVDYSKMVPFTEKVSSREKISYAGKASARVSIKDNVAKLETMQSRGVSMTMESASRSRPATVNIPGLGPGGLGSTTDKNHYTCDGDLLEYQTSRHIDGHANCTVKLTRVKP